MADNCLNKLKRLVYKVICYLFRFLTLLLICLASLFGDGSAAFRYTWCFLPCEVVFKICYNHLILFINTLNTLLLEFLTFDSVKYNEITVFNQIIAK